MHCIKAKATSSVNVLKIFSEDIAHLNAPSSIYGLNKIQKTMYRKSDMPKAGRHRRKSSSTEISRN